MNVQEVQTRKYLYVEIEEEVETFQLIYLDHPDRVQTTRWISCNIEQNVGGQAESLSACLRFFCCYFCNGLL